MNRVCIEATEDDMKFALTILAAARRRPRLFRRCVMSNRYTHLPIIVPAATGAAVAAVSLALLGASCSRTSIPLAPSRQLAAGSNAALNGTGDHSGHHATSQSTTEDKGYIDSWFDGHDVRLYYTKSGTSARSHPRVERPRTARSARRRSSRRDQVPSRRSMPLLRWASSQIRRQWRASREAHVSTILR